MPIQYTFTVPCSCGCGKDVKDVRQFFATPYCRVKASRSNDPMIKKSIDEGEFENVPVAANPKSATNKKTKASPSGAGEYPGMCSHGSMKGLCKRGCK